MSVPVPQLPQFRITLFYGPEAVEGDPPRLSCVFNVKKRSWKGGVQVVVEMDRAQVEDLRMRLRLDSWLSEILRGTAAADRREYEQRAGDLLVQQFCQAKLDLAVEGQVLEQHNARLDSSAYRRELNDVAMARVDHIKANILAELDLPSR